MFSFSTLERSFEGMYFGEDVDREAEAEPLIEVSLREAAMAAARSGSSCSFVLIGCSAGFGTDFCGGTYPPRPPPPPPSPE